MSESDWQWLVAAIGALAWMPILGRLLYDWLVKPQLDIVVGRTGELGFTSFGTILNLQVAIRGRRKPALITKAEMQLVHQNGRTINLLWDQINESLSTAWSSTGDQASYSRNLPAIAVQVLPDVEIRPVWVGFNDAGHRARVNELGAALGRRIQRLGAAPTPAQIEQTDEYHDLQEFFSNAFQWEAGTYTGTVRVSVSELPEPIVVPFHFELTDGNVVHVQGNQPKIQSYLRDVANNQNPVMPVWNWLYPAIQTN